MNQSAFKRSGIISVSVITSVVATLIGAGAVAAQGRPDFSGTWTAVAQGYSGELQPVEAGWTLSIEQDASQISMTLSRGPLEHELVYLLGGLESRNERSTVTGDAWTHVSNAVWIADAIVIGTTTTWPKGHSYESVSTYSLDPYRRLIYTQLEPDIRSQGHMVLETVVWVREPLESVSRSIPSPTELSSVARTQGTSVIATSGPARITSSDAVAEITGVEIITLDGDRHRGVGILLRNTDQAEEVEIYLDTRQAAWFRDELSHLDRSYEYQAAAFCRGVCYHGSARCRPSQTVPQALCPAAYVRSEHERGTVLATADWRYHFPSVRPVEFADAMP